MASTPQERLAVIAAAYQAANRNRDSDIAAAQNDAQYEAIVANLRKLEEAYLDAANAALAATGPAVESCFQAAQSAANAVEQAYSEGKAIADRIRAVASAVTAVTNLVAAATAAA